MACPNCDHTMQLIAGKFVPSADDYRVWWCPRCGTIKDIDGQSTPMLVGRISSFVKQLGDDDDTIKPFFHKAGILESLPKGTQ